jgi:uroporphyrinogen decarboxylase
MEKLSDITFNFLALQAEAGVDALQLFDSWVGVLPAVVYEEAIFPHTVKLLNRLKTFNLPLIHFGISTEHLFPLYAKAGSDVVGLDCTVDVKRACEGVLKDVVVQGNLDPAVLFSNKEFIRREVKRILAEAKNAKGHIFNLGHGVLQETPVDNVAFLVDCVHEESANG